MDRGSTAIIQGLCAATVAGALPALVPAGRAASAGGPLAIRQNPGMIVGSCIGGAPVFAGFILASGPAPGGS